MVEVTHVCDKIHVKSVRYKEWEAANR